MKDVVRLGLKKQWWEKRQDDCVDIYIQWVLLVLMQHLMLLWNTLYFYYKSVNWWVWGDFVCHSHFSKLDYGESISPRSLQLPLLTSAIIFEPSWCRSWTTDNQHFDLSLYPDRVLRHLTHGAHCIDELEPCTHVHWLLFYLHVHYMSTQTESGVVAVAVVTELLHHTNAEFHML